MAADKFYWTTTFALGTTPSGVSLTMGKTKEKAKEKAKEWASRFISWPPKASSSSTSSHEPNGEQLATAPASFQNSSNSLANPSNSQSSNLILAPSEPRPSSSRSLLSATPPPAPQTTAPNILPATGSANAPLIVVDFAKVSTETSLVQCKQTTPVQGVAMVPAPVTTEGSGQPVHPVLGASAPTSSSQALAAVWQRSIQIAQEKLLEKNLPPLPLDGQTSQTTNDVIDLMIGDLQSLIKKNSGRRAGVERLGKILRTVEKYAKIVDTAIQHSPQFSSLVWAGIRAIVQMAVCEFYSSVYGETLKVDGLQKTLDLALPEFYAAVLVFSVKARQYLVPSNVIKKLGNILKPFAVELQPFIQDISDKEARVRKCADMATMERIMKNSKQLEQMYGLLSQIESMLTKAKEIAMFASKAEESPKRHQDMRAKRYAGTGAWLLQCERFRLWNNGTQANPGNRAMCCYGMPGAGKTVISSAVIDHLISQHGEPQVAYIYCDYRDQTNQTVVHILGSFLKQLLSAAIHAVPKSTISELESIQRQDALDELEPRVRLELLRLLQSEFGSARIFLTGRPHIQSDINRVFKVNPEDAIHITADRGDIKAYLNHEVELDMEMNPDEMNESLKQEILEVILSKADGMFLLPALHISMVLEQPTIGERRRALELLPSKLDDAYGQTVQRIQISRSLTNLGMRVLMWLHLATRPLKIVELQCALAVVLEPGKRGNIDLDEDQIPKRKRLLDCCLGLVIVDEETLTVRFVHYTLEEYFKTHFDTYFPNGHSTAAEVCLTYLNFDKLLASPNCLTLDDIDQRKEQWPFLEYAACQWGHYAPAKNWNKKDPDEREDVDVNLKDALSYTPLAHAAENGHEAIVRLLLEREDVDVNLKDVLGYTPLARAARNGHEAVVRLFLEREDMDVNSKGSYNYTPLAHAAKNGHEAVVRLFLEREDVDVNSKNALGYTPLARAAEKGCEAVVRLFLEREDVDVNSKDIHGKTPLARVAENGHEAVVRLLLGREDVDVNSKDKFGYSPLTYASRINHTVITQLLIQHGGTDTRQCFTD
ncbi:hypothetical protein EV426DRAFT_574568 [Tirmania nivea]|nr:hypothetical protein EV426DRAFT_574568 [Tirmania nivea]